MSVSRRTTLGGLVSVFAIAQAPPGLAQSVARVEIAGSSLGGSIYGLAQAWARIVNANSKTLQLSASSTSGAVENLQLVGREKSGFGWVATPALASAFLGIDDFQGKALPKLRSVFSYYYGGFQTVVREDSGIKTMADLKGKRISLGPPGGVTGSFMKLALVAHGVKDGEYRPQFLSANASADALKNGAIDAFCFAGPPGTPFIVNLALDRKLRLIPFDGPGMDKLLEQTSGYFKDIYQPNAYPNLGNTGQIETLSYTQTVATTSATSDAVVYEATKLLFDNLADFHASNDVAKEIVLEKALVGMAVPLHRGALRYYQEKGLNVPAALVPPEAK